ncbi:SNF2-related protein [Streptomyces sp. NPDC097619]|uniref:DEAD/DEAH box helicase family protein n=1 Tax=Streptomyces sp. NPDC097619 TaxID=3157228 RepID=UPI0033341D5D
MQITNAAARLEAALESKRTRRPWNPDLHPRDSKGRFIETGGIARIWGSGLARVLRSLGGRNVLVENLTTREQSTVHASRLTMVARPDGTAPTKSKKKVRDEDERRAGDGRRGTGLDTDDEGDQGDTPDAPHEQDDRGDDIGEDNDEDDDLGEGPEPEDDDPAVPRGRVFQDGEAATQNPAGPRFDALKIASGGRPRARHRFGQGDALRAPGPKSTKDPKRLRFTDDEHAEQALLELDQQYLGLLTQEWDEEWDERDARSVYEQLLEEVNDLTDADPEIEEGELAHLAGRADWLGELAEAAGRDDLAEAAFTLADALDLADDRFTAHGGKPIPAPRKGRTRASAWEPAAPATPARPARKTAAAAPRRRRDPNRKFQSLDDVRAHWASGNLPTGTTSERRQAAHATAVAELMDKLDKPQLSRSGHFIVGQLTVRGADGKEDRGWAVMHTDSGIRLTLTGRKGEATEFANRLETVAIGGDPVDWNDPDSLQRLKSPEGQAAVNEAAAAAREAFDARAAQKRSSATQRTRPAPETGTAEQEAARTIAARTGVPAGNVVVGQVGGPTAGRPRTDAELREFWKNGGINGRSRQQARKTQADILRRMAGDPDLNITLASNPGFAIVENTGRDDDFRYTVMTAGSGRGFSGLGKRRIQSHGHFADRETADRFALYLGSNLRDGEGRTLDWGDPEIAAALPDFRDKDDRPFAEAVWDLAGRFDRERGADTFAARSTAPRDERADRNRPASGPDQGQEEQGQERNAPAPEQQEEQREPEPAPVPESAPGPEPESGAARPASQDREIAAADARMAVDQMILGQRGTLQDEDTSRKQIERAEALVAALRDGEADSVAELGEILSSVEQAVRSRTDGLDDDSKRYWLNEIAEGRRALMRAEARLGDDGTDRGRNSAPPQDTTGGDREQVRPAGQAVLADVPARGAEESGRPGRAGRVLPRAGEPNPDQDRRSRRGAAGEDAAGDDPGRSGGPDAVPGSGDGADPGRGDVPAEGAGDGAPGAGRDPDPVATAVRFRPGSQNDLAPAGERSKSKANVAAIRALRDIQAQGRPATAEEQQILARWSGWGSLPVVLSDKPDPADPRFRDSEGEPDPAAYARALARWESFAEERAEVRALLDDAEWAAARKNTLNAHYTDASLVAPVWDALRDLGFRRGRVLEPGSGSGNFIGQAPDGAEMVGVELDPTTAAISQLLYPDARIVNSPFEKLRLPPDSFDAAVGNVPFGKFRLFDPIDNPGRHHSIHDHFILKSLARVRPGGYVALVTSRFTLDSQDDSARQAMYDMADLVGAVRLPAGAHQKAAGTDVVTDLLLFRRRDPNRSRTGRGDDTWLTSTPTNVGGYEIPVNNYFQDNPKNILGRLETERGAFSDHDLTVKGDGNTLPALRAALGRITADAKAAGLEYDASSENRRLSLDLADDARDGSIARGADGAFMTVEDGTWVELDVHPSQHQQLGRLLELKDLSNRLLDLEQNTREPGETDAMREARAALALAYDAYVRKHPSPNKPGQRRRFSPPEALARRKAEGLKEVPDEWKLDTALALFEDDPDGHMVFGLDRWDADAKAPRKLEILSSRVLQPREIPDRADTPEEAVPIALERDGGRLELPTLARLLGLDQTAAREAVGELAFDDPATGRLEARASYLSGNVRRKLAEAKAAAAEDPKYQANVAALERVVPTDIRAKDIRVKIGAPWVPTDVYEGFLRHLGLSNGAVSNLGGSRWKVVGTDSGEIATKVWGIPRRSAYDIFDSLLHQRLITVVETQRLPDGTEKKFVNQKATSAARAKAKDMAREFQKWVMSDPQRAVRLGRIYNDKFNSIALRDYDSSPLTLPGIRTGWRMRPHQNAAIRRIVQEPTTLLGHVVGAGKTATMVAGAMELRRTGLAKKPSIVVPNHMLEQFSREAVALYPGAKVLAISRKDLHRKKRRKFIAKIAGGDWDIVVLTHDAFNAMPMTPATQQGYMDKELALLREQIVKLKERDGKSPTLKQMETVLANQEAKLAENLEKLKDERGIFFENTGIDYLFVDEAHEYKNLRTISNLPGAAIEGSGQATQLHMALGYLRRHNESGRVATLATGTPIANSVTEAYVLMRYLAPEILEDAGIEDFDSWAATFGEVVTKLEQAPDGSGDYREKARFAKFFNVPELLVGYRTFADIQTAADLGLPTPTVRAGANGRRGEVVAIPASAEQRRYVASLADEDWIKKPGGVLKAIGAASRAAIDMRLQGGSGHEGGKLDAAAQQIAKIYVEHKDTVYPVSRNNLTPQELPGALQLVFLDDGTPGSTGQNPFNSYEAMRDLLVEQGVPREKVRFIHEAKDDKAKAKLFEEARSGKIAVLIGSTAKMGTGTNVQDRAVALHHVSYPWRPADMEQRDGRIERQGNLHGANIPAAPGGPAEDVRILYYITEGTFDEFRLGILEGKAVFINQLARRDFKAREMEDIGDIAVSMGTFRAIASGNPAIAERAQAQSELVELQRLSADWYEQQQDRRQRIDYLTGRIAGLEAALPGMRDALTRRRDISGDGFEAVLDGVDYRSRPEAAQALGERMAALAKDTRRREGSTRLGEIGGVGVLADIEYDRDGNRLLRLRLDHAPAYTGTAFPETRGLWSARKVDDTSGRGGLQSLENLLRSLDSDVDKRQAELDGARRSLRDAKTYLQEGTSPYEEAAEATERRVQALGELVMRHQEARKLTDRIKAVGPNPDAAKLRKRLKELQQETALLEKMAAEDRAKTIPQPEAAGPEETTPAEAAPAVRQWRPGSLPDDQLDQELQEIEGAITDGTADDAAVDRHATLTAERARRTRAARPQTTPEAAPAERNTDAPAPQTAPRPPADSSPAPNRTAPPTPDPRPAPDPDPTDPAPESPDTEQDTTPAPAPGPVEATPPAEQPTPDPGDGADERPATDGPEAEPEAGPDAERPWAEGDEVITPRGPGTLTHVADNGYGLAETEAGTFPIALAELRRPGEDTSQADREKAANAEAKRQQEDAWLASAATPEGAPIRSMEDYRLADLDVDAGHGSVMRDGRMVAWIRARSPKGTAVWLAQDARGGRPQRSALRIDEDNRGQGIYRSIAEAAWTAAYNADSSADPSRGAGVTRPEDMRGVILGRALTQAQFRELEDLAKRWERGDDEELRYVARNYYGGQVSARQMRHAADAVDREADTLDLDTADGRRKEKLYRGLAQGIRRQARALEAESTMPPPGEPDPFSTRDDSPDTDSAPDPQEDGGEDDSENEGPDTSPEPDPASDEERPGSASEEGREPTRRPREDDRGGRDGGDEPPNPPSGATGPADDDDREDDDREGDGEGDSPTPEGPEQGDDDREPKDDEPQERRRRPNSRDRNRRDRERDSGRPAGPRPRVPDTDRRNRRDDDDDDNEGRRAVDPGGPERLRELTGRYRSGGAPVPAGADPDAHARYLRGLADNDSLTLSPDGGLITWTNSNDAGTWRYGHAASGLHLEGWQADGSAIGGREGARRLAGAYERLLDRDGRAIDWAAPQLDPQALKTWRDEQGNPLTTAVDQARLRAAGADAPEVPPASDRPEAPTATESGPSAGSTDTEPDGRPDTTAATSGPAPTGRNTPRDTGTPGGTETGRREGAAPGSRYAVNATGSTDAGTVNGRRVPTHREMEQYEDGPDRVISRDGEQALFGSPEEMLNLAGEGFVPSPLLRTDGGGQVWRDGRRIGGISRDGDGADRPYLSEGPFTRNPLVFRTREAAVAHLVLRDMERGEPDLAVVHPDLAATLAGPDVLAAFPSDTDPTRGPDSLLDNPEDLERYRALRRLLDQLGAGVTPSGNVADDLARLHAEARWLDGAHSEERGPGRTQQPVTGAGWLADRAGEYLDVLRPEDPRAEHHDAARNRAARQFLDRLLADGDPDTAERVPADRIRAGDVVRLDGRVISQGPGFRGSGMGFVVGEPEKATLTIPGRPQERAMRITISTEPFGPRDPRYNHTFLIPVDGPSGLRLARAEDTDLPFEQHRYGRQGQTPAPAAPAPAADAPSPRPTDGEDRPGPDETDTPTPTPAPAPAVAPAPAGGARAGVGRAPGSPARTADAPPGPRPEEEQPGTGDASAGRRRPAAPTSTSDADPDAPAEPEEIGGRPAEWVKISDLVLGDLARVEGITSGGTPRVAAGYVVDGPREINTVVKRRLQGMHRVLISDTPDGRGHRTPVWVVPDAAVARATRDTADQGPQEPLTGADSTVLTGNLSERVPTDRAGVALFPGSLVTDPDGREGIVTGANAGAVRVQFGDDRTDDAHAPTSLTVTDGGAARAAGWSPDGQRIRSGAIVHERDGRPLGTVEVVDGDTVTVATPQGPQERPAAELGVARQIPAPGAPDAGARLDRVPAQDLVADRDTILVDGPDGFAPALVTGIEAVSPTHTRITAVDTTTGEIHDLHGRPDGVYMRVSGPDGGPVDLGPNDVPDRTGPVRETGPAPEIRPVSEPTVAPQLGPAERAAVADRGRTAADSDDATQGGARIGQGLPVTAGQAQAVAEGLRHDADPDTPEGRAAQRAADALDAAAGIPTSPDPAPEPEPRPGTIAGVGVGVGDTIALPDEFNPETLTAYRVTDIEEAPAGIRVLTIEDGDGLRFTRPLPGATALHQLPDPNPPTPDTDPAPADPAPDFEELRRQYTDTVIESVIDSALQGALTPGSIHQLREQIAAQVVPARLAGAMRRARRATLAAIDGTGIEGEARDEQVRLLRPAAARARRDAIRAVLRTINDLEPLPDESQEDTARRAADLLRLIPEALRTRPTPTPDAGGDGVQEAVTDHVQGPLEEALREAGRNRPLTGRRQAAILERFAAEVAASRQAAADRILAGLPTQRRRPGVTVQVLAALALLARKLIALVAAFLKALAELWRRGRAHLQAVRARISRFRRTLMQRIRSWPESRRLRRLAAATDLPAAGDGLPLADRVAHWSRLLPAPGRFGQVSRRTRWYRPASRDQLDARRLPPVQDSVRWGADRAVDGGPGPQALRHLAAVRAAGQDVDTDLASRLTAAAPELGDDPHGLVRAATGYVDSAERRVRDLEAAGGEDAEAEIAAARAEAALARQEADRLTASYAAALPGAVRDTLAELREMGQGPTATLAIASGSDPEAARALREIAEFLPRDWIAAVDDQALTALTGTEGGYRAPHRTATVADLADGGRRTAAYALLAHLQQHHPDLLAAQEAFHFTRTHRGRVGARRRTDLDRLLDRLFGGRTVREDTGGIVPMGWASLFSGDWYKDDDLRAFLLGLLATR